MNSKCILILLFLNWCFKFGSYGAVSIIHWRIEHQISSSFETKILVILGSSVETKIGKYAFAHWPFQCSGQKVHPFQADLQKILLLLHIGTKANSRKTTMFPPKLVAS